MSLGRKSVVVAYVNFSGVFESVPYNKLLKLNVYGFAMMFSCDWL